MFRRRQLSFQLFIAIDMYVLLQESDPKSLQGFAQFGILMSIRRGFLDFHRHRAQLTRLLRFHKKNKLKGFLSIEILLQFNMLMNIHLNLSYYCHHKFQAQLKVHLHKYFYKEIKGLRNPNLSQFDRNLSNVSVINIRIVTLLILTKSSVSTEIDTSFIYN